MVFGPSVVGRLYKALVPEMLNTPKTVTEMDACGVRRNGGVRRENDAAVVELGMVAVEELAKEEPLVGRAANVVVTDAKELNWPERLLNVGGKRHVTLGVDLHTCLCMT